MRTIKEKVIPIPAHIDPEKAKERDDLASYRKLVRQANTMPETPSDKPN